MLNKSFNISITKNKAITISKTKIIEDLQNRFNGLEKIKLLWEKNPKEEVAKNIHRLKWLPKEKVQLK